MSRPVVALAGPFPPPFGGMAVYFGTLADRLEGGGVGCRRIRIPVGSPGVRLGGFLGASWRILGTDADVVHCITGSQPNLLANALPLAAARAARKPSLLSIVGGEFHGAVAGGSALRRFVLRRVLALPHRVVACNDEIAEALRLLGVPDRRIAVVSNALPAPERSSDASLATGSAFAGFAATHRPLLTSVSGWYEHYGSLDLLHAFAALRERHPELGLALIVKEGGDREFAETLRAWIGDRGLSDHVLLLSNVPSATAVMARSDVFVRTPHLEGDSVSVREALAAGVPVVASDAGFRPPGVVLFRPADPADLEAKLEQVLTSPAPEPAEDLDAEGRENFERLLAVYRELAGVS